MSSPPGGTVTFLLTDMEGSTRRWEEHPQAMKVALALHDRIVRDAIQANGGYLFQTIGDAFCAAFPTAPQALNAVMQIHCKLHEQEWGDVGPLRVRVALHSGAAGSKAGAGDYSGPVFDRAARLLPIGHGGQTLLTPATEQLLRDQLPPEATLVDMGERRFRDLLHSEHVFSMLIAGLPYEFAPLKTLEGTPNNLPVRSTQFVGREKELGECAGILRRSDVRLLTLVGPGGIGKTRLSLHLAAAMLDDFLDGVFVVGLSHITDPNLVPQAIAQVLGVRQTGSRPVVESLKEYLHDKRMMLIFDNFEHVLDAAPLIWVLLSAAPGLKVVATSRSTLDLAAEHIYEAPPLSLPDPVEALDLESLSRSEAANLFITRAKAVKPDLNLTADNARAIASICAQLDGLPLAIELAAARIKILSPQMILARLSNALKLLTGGDRDLPARQQTMQATIQWSYDLLNEEEKALFRWLSVFVKGASLEAIEAICDPGIGGQGPGDG